MTDVVLAGVTVACAEGSYHDGEVVAAAGSGRYLRRAFHRPAPGPAVR